MFSQPIISKAKPQLLKTHFLPLMDKLKTKAAVVVSDEEHLRAEGRGDMSEAELLILDEFTTLARDLYAFYPLLIRFVDYNRYVERNRSMNLLKSSCLLIPSLSP